MAMETDRDVRHLDPRIRERLQLEDALGCAGFVVYDNADEEEVSDDDGMFDCESDDPDARLIEEFGTILLHMADAKEAEMKKENEDSETEDDQGEVDVGVIVPVLAFDGQDIGNMIKDMRAATTFERLMTVLDKYKDVPGAEEFKEACARRLAAVSVQSA